MVSKNNLQYKREASAYRTPHYGLRKLSVGVASVLLGTTLYFGATAQAATDETTATTNQDPISNTDQATDTTNKSQLQNQVVKLSTPPSTAPNNTDSTEKTDQIVDATATEKMSTAQDAVVSTDQQTVSQSNPRMSVTVKFSNVIKGDEYRVVIPHTGIWKNGTVFSPNFTGNIGTVEYGQDKDTGDFFVDYHISNTPTGSVTQTITLNKAEYSPVLDEIGDYTKTIKVYRIRDGQSKLLNSVSYKESVHPQFGGTIQCADVVNPKTKNKYTLKLHDNLSGYTIDPVLQKLSDFSIAVPENFKLDSNIGGVTQDKPGAPIVVHNYQGIPNFFTFSGEYDVDWPADDKTVSVKDSEGTVTVNGHQCPLSIDGWHQIIACKDHEEQEGYLLSGDIQDAYIASGILNDTYKGQPDNYVPLNADEDYQINKIIVNHSGKIDPQKVNNITYTGDFSKGYAISYLVPAKALPNGTKLHLTYYDGSSEDIGTIDGLYHIAPDRGGLQSFSYTLPTWQDVNWGVNGRVDNKVAHNNDLLKVTFNVQSGTLAPKNKVTSWSGSQRVTDKIQPNVFTLSPVQKDDAVNLGQQNAVSLLVSHNYDSLTTQALSNPTLYIVLPETVSGLNHCTNNDLDITTETVNGRKVLVCRMNGTVDPARINFGKFYFNLVNDLPNTFRQGEVYITADNANGENITNPAAAQSNYQNLPTLNGLKAYKIGTFNARIAASKGTFVQQAAQGNQDGGLNSQGQSTFSGDNHIIFSSSIINATGDDETNDQTIINVPQQNGDGTFGVIFSNDQPVQVIDANTGKAITDAQVMYSTTPVTFVAGQPSDLSGFVTADQITDWTSVKAIYVKVPTLQKEHTARVVFDTTVADPVANIGKSAYLSSKIWGDNITPSEIQAKSAGSAKATINGQVNIHREYHYQDENGVDHYVKLPDITGVTGQELTNTQLSGDDKIQIPAGYWLKDNKDIPSRVTDGHKTWVSGEQNGTLDLTQALKYYADDDTLVYELVKAKKTNIVVTFIDDTNIGQPKTLKEFSLTGAGGTKPSSAEEQAIQDALTAYFGQKYSIDNDAIAAFNRGGEYGYMPFGNQNPNDPTGKTIDFDDLAFQIDSGEPEPDGQDHTTLKITIPLTKNIIQSPHRVPLVRQVPFSFKGELKPDLKSTDSPLKYSDDSTVSDMLGQLINLSGISIQKNTDGHYTINGTAYAGLQDIFDNMKTYGITSSVDSTPDHLKVVLNLANFKLPDEETGEFKLWKAFANPGKEASMLAAQLTFEVNLKAAYEAEQQGANGDQNAKYPAGTFKYDCGDDHYSSAELAVGEDDQGPTIPLIWHYTVNDKYINVTGDNPGQPGKPLPDNPNKTYPTGTGKDDLSHSATRTITIHVPGQPAKQIVQNGHVSRTMTIDEATGEVTSTSDWSTDQWDALNAKDIPLVPGYTATISSIPSQKIDHQTQDVNVDITYTPNYYSGKITYLDQDQGNKVIKTDTQSGKTGDTVNVHTSIPAGYELVPGQAKLPDHETVTVDGLPDHTVVLRHKTVTVTPHDQTKPGDKLPDNPDKTYPDGIKDLSKTVTRTIIVNDPVTHEQHRAIQKVTLTRSAVVDEVTGGVKRYTDWTPDKNWADYKAPIVDGYTPEIADVPEQDVDVNTQDVTVTINYHKNGDNLQQKTGQIIYVDKTNSNRVVQITTVTGTVGKQVAINKQIPNGYEEVPGQNIPTSEDVTMDGIKPVTIELQHKTVSVTPDQPKVPGDKLPDNGNLNYPSGVGESDLNKTITRTITIIEPDRTKNTISQQVHLTRSATVDEVTGKVINYTPWTESNWAAYDAPEIAGYTPTIAHVDSQKVDYTTQDSKILIKYNPTSDDPQVQTGKVEYIDINSNNKLIKTDSLSGEVGGKVDIHLDIPAGYELVPDQTIPDQEPVQPTGIDTVTVKLQHKTITVDPTKPHPAGDPLPDNPSQKYPSGLSKSDLEKKVTRTIIVTNKDGSTHSVTKQVSTLKRTATVDEVTGQVTYGDWSLAKPWDEFVDVPPIPGYKPSSSKVAQKHVDANTNDETVMITYAPTSHTGRVIYKDENNHNQVIPNAGETISGKTDQVITVNPQIPAGYELVHNEDSTKTVRVGSDEKIPDVVFTLRHKIVTVTSDDPKTQRDVLPDNPTKKYPTGVAKDDLYHQATRTITIQTPGEQTVTNFVAPQTGTATRTAKVDEVTGKVVTYGPWKNGNWAAVNQPIPTVEGYTPEIVDAAGNVLKGQDGQPLTSIPSEAVTGSTQDQTLHIVYSPNEQTGKVVYVDTDNGNKEITSAEGTTSGKTGEEVTVTANVPAGYELVPDEKITKTVTAGTTQIPDVTFKLKHGTKPASRTETVTETVHYVFEDGQTARPDQTKTVTFTQTGTEDSVTHKVIWDPVADQSFAAVSSPDVLGYTPDIKEVPSMTVKYGDKAVTKTVTYHADPQRLTVTYIDDVTGRVLKTVTKDGYSDQPAGYNTNTDLQSFLHQYYAVVSDSTKGADLVFDHDDGVDQAYAVHLTHQTEQVSRTKQISRTINYVDATTGQQLKPSVTQTLTFTQQGTKDLVTGQVTWNSVNPQTFASVTSPVIDGYKEPSIAAVTEQTVADDSDNLVVNVEYTKPVSHNGGSDTPANVIDTSDVDHEIGAKSPNHIANERNANDSGITNEQTANGQSTKQSALPQTGNDSKLGALGLLTVGLAGLLGLRKKQDD